MNPRSACPLPLLLMLLVAAGVAGETINVPTDASTLEQAVLMAGDGDIIEITPGEYLLSGFAELDLSSESVTVYGKALTIRGLGGQPEDTRLTAPPGFPAAGVGGTPQPVLAVHDAAGITLENLSVLGGPGGTGLPPAQCNGGTGGTGGVALSLVNVDRAVLRDVVLTGGDGGAGEPNTGGCPASGTTGDGGTALTATATDQVFLTGSTLTGGCGTAEGNSAELDQNSLLLHFQSLFGTTPCGTGEAVLLDAQSEVREITGGDLLMVR